MCKIKEGKSPNENGKNQLNFILNIQSQRKFWQDFRFVHMLQMHAVIFLLRKSILPLTFFNLYYLPFQFCVLLLKIKIGRYINAKIKLFKISNTLYRSKVHKSKFVLCLKLYSAIHWKMVTFLPIFLKKMTFL